MMLTKQDYLEKRVKAQQSFFSQKAANNKKKYYMGKSLRQERNEHV